MTSVSCASHLRQLRLWRQDSLNPPGTETAPCSPRPQHCPSRTSERAMTQSCHSRIPYTAENTYKKNILPNILLFRKRFRFSPVKILSFGLHYTFLGLIWRFGEHGLKWPYYPSKIYVATSKLKLLFKNSDCFFVFLSALLIMYQACTWLHFQLSPHPRLEKLKSTMGTFWLSMQQSLKWWLR